MSGPTIDEMLKVLDSIPETYLNDKEIDAIRAILEQHRHNEENARRADLSAIRAFVERVEKRADAYDAGGWTQANQKALRDELAAMEKEAE